MFMTVWLIMVYLKRSSLNFLTMILRKLFQVACKLLEERWPPMYTVSAQRQNSYPTFKLSHHHYHPLFAVPSFMIRLTGKLRKCNIPLCLLIFPVNQNMKEWKKERGKKEIEPIISYR